MKVLQTIPAFGAKMGGTSTATYDLMCSLQHFKKNIDLLTLNIKNPNFDTLIGQGESWIKALPNDSFSPYGYSIKIRNYLRDSDYDVYHTNGLWMYTNHQTCLQARRSNKPYVITPHGMLYPLALKRSFWKKWPLLQLYFKKDILTASCIHVTCQQEMEHVRRFGYQGPIAIIPNPAVIPDYTADIFNTKRQRIESSSKYRFGFLGRIHPVKGIENLIRGLSLIKENSKVELVIIGKGDNRYEQSLRAEIDQLKLNNVSFKGFVKGKDKFEMLADLSALFVPSDFENFGMIVTEALSVGTPVMASLGTPWEDLNIYNCGWWNDRNPENIAKVMQEIMDKTITDLLDMGCRGRSLVLQKFAADRIAQQMLDMYHWLIKEGHMPSFVYKL